MDYRSGALAARCHFPTGMLESVHTHIHTQTFIYTVYKQDLIMGKKADLIEEKRKKKNAFPCVFYS